LEVVPVDLMDLITDRPVHTYHQVKAVQVSGLNVLNSAIKANHAPTAHESTMVKVLDQDHSKDFLVDHVILENLFVDHQILIFHRILQVVRDLQSDLEVEGHQKSTPLVDRLNPMESHLLQVAESVDKAHPVAVDQVDEFLKVEGLSDSILLD
jgi:hypothetical protein